MPIFTVNSELCRMDGICASVCPAHVIKGSKGRLPVMRPNKECIACGQCMAFCPHGAAGVDVLAGLPMPRLERMHMPDAESLDMLILSRRSIRHFKKESLPRGFMEHLLDMASYAPSAKNRRLTRWVVLNGREKLRQFGDLAIAGLKESLENGGTMIKEGKSLVKAWSRGLDPLFRGAPDLVLAVIPKETPFARVDAAIALTYLEITALARNIGACWAGYATTLANAHAPARAFLGLADNEEVGGAQMLGHIGLRPAFAAPRAHFPVAWL